MARVKDRENSQDDKNRNEKFRCIANEKIPPKEPKGPYRFLSEIHDLASTVVLLISAISSAVAAKYKTARTGRAASAPVQ
jgi:hypothetical protein